MRKRLYLGVLLLLTLSCININAEVITLDGATELANTFFSQNVSQQKRLLKSATPQLEYAWDSNSLTQSGNTLLKSVEEDPTFYVFNNTDGEGFVIVSGDSNTRSIIGYSYEGNAPAVTDIPLPMQDYLSGIDAEVKYARTNLTSTSKNLKATEVETGGTVVKHLETAIWNQTSPFGNKASNSLSGCVPTAFAIVMRYHEWPLQGKVATLPSGTQTIDLSSHIYDWSKMPLSYLNGYTDEQGEAVAQLMSDLGASMAAEYLSGSTDVQLSSNIGRRFQSNFDYSGEYDMAQKDVSYADNEEGWITRIQESINNNCPIPYSGTRTEGGTHGTHMFVLDGYTDNDYFHFNWGWGGSGNGWFTLSTMGEEGSQYIQSNKAFFNLKPNKQVTVSVAADPDTAGTITIDGESVTSKEVEVGSTVTLQATGENFYGWLVNGEVVSTENPYSATINSGITYTAKFATSTDLYLQAALVSEGGDYELDEVNKPTASTYTIIEGVSIELNANTQRGYSFLGWYDADENLIDSETPTTINITSQIYENPYIFAKYSQLSPIQPTVVSSNSDMGSASYSITAGTQELYVGEEITLVATPKSGYMFTGWSDGTSTISTSKTYTVAVEEGKTYTANFALSGADYTVSYNTGTFVETGLSRRSTWTYTTTDTNPVPLQITTTSGTTEVLGMNPTSNRYYASTFDKDGTTGYNTITYTLSVPEGYIITGYEMTYWLGSSSYNGQVTVSNATSTNTPTDTSDQTLLATNLTEQTTSFTVSASQTGQQYIGFSSFIVSVLSTGGGEVPPTQYTVTATANPETAGSATVAVGTGQGAASQTVDSGTTVILSASPNNGYTFVNWTLNGNEVSTSASFSTNPVTADADYVANFTEEGNSANTVALINSAKELKNKTGVGYPNETERTTLQSAIDAAEANPTASAGTTLQSAIDAYYATTNVQMPTAGTTYSFIVGHDTKYYIYNNEGTLSLASYTEGETELPATAKFTCEVSGNYYMFKTSDNKYMAFPPYGTGNYSDASPDGIEDTASELTKFSIAKLYNNINANVTVSNQDLFGNVYLTVLLRGHKTDGGAAESGIFVVKTTQGIWDGALNPYDNGTFSSAISIIEVEAESTPETPQYTITVSAEPAEGGEATVAVGTGEASSSLTVDAGTNVTITATPADGYEFVNWTNGGSILSTNTTETYPINANISLIANFRQTEQGGDVIEVAQLDRTNWSVTASSQAPEEGATNGGEARHAIDNSTTTFWHTQWQGSTPNAPHWIQFNMGAIYKVESFNYVSRDAATTNITGNGNIKTYKLYISDSDISADINATSYIPNGLTPVKDENFVYDGSTANHNVTLDSPVYGQYIYMLVTDSYNSHASIKFANCADFQVYGKPAYTVSATASPVGGGTASVSANVIGAGESVTFTASPNTGYNFLGWYNGENKVSESLEYTATVTSDLSLTAKFEKQTFTVSATPEGTNGTVTVSPNGTVEYGTQVTFTATANPGYRFVQWSNGETANPYVTTITANTELTASFELIPTYTVNVTTNGTGGTATASSNSVEENGTVTLTAEPKDGYRFTGWYQNEELVSMANPYTIQSVTGNINYVANFVESSDELLLTFACLSDLHAQQDLITDANNIQLRESVTKTLNQIKSQENVDLIVLGGDYTSNNAIPETSWETTRELLVNATRGAFNADKTPVIYVNGNHDYEVANYDNPPRDYNAGEYYGTPMKTDIGALAAEDCFYETADNGTGTAFRLLAAYHYVVNGFDFVVLNAGKNLFASASDYTYSLESVQWCESKLAEIYATDKNKTVFFLVHIPFSDSKGISNVNKGMNKGADANFISALKTSLSQYPNLIMLYGHDHGTDSAYIRTSTSERVTEYATDGSVYTGAGAASSTYYIQNYNTSKYLGYNSYNLATTDTQSSDVTITPSTVTDGAFVFDLSTTLTNGTGNVIRYLHCGSSGRFSGNNENTATNQQIKVFKVEDPSAATLTATQVTEITSGGTYMLVASNDGGTNYYALSDEMHSNNSSEQRMKGAAVTITDGTITYAPGTASVLWNIVKKPSATDKSFISSFMGSMRYYENSFESGQIDERRIVQALMVYVYSDRVELKMKNYGDEHEQGNVTANGITINQDLTPYVSYRTVTHSDYAVTAAPTITSTGDDVSAGTEVTVTVDAPEWHNLYYTVNGDTPTESSDIVENGQITFTATEGEYVVKVVAQEGIRLVSPVSEVTYRVIDTHGITVSATEGGTADFSINEGEGTVTLTATEPTEGYYFVGWSVGESAEIVSEDLTYTISIVENAAYKANYAKRTYTVTVSTNNAEWGTVNTIANPVTHGETVTLTATPAEGYRFVNWTVSGNQVSTSAEYTTDAITADVEYIANFQLSVQTEKLTITEANIAGMNHYTAEGGYPVSKAIDGNRNTLFMSAAGPGVDAAFTITLRKLSNVYEIKQYYDPSSNDLPQNAVIEISTDNQQWTKVADVNTSVINDKEFSCNAGGAEAKYIRIRFLASQNQWFRLNEFEAYGVEIIQYFAVSASTDNRVMGKATMSVAGPTVEEGTSVTFTATPYSGYEFVNWTNAEGTSVSTSASYTTTIDADTELTANFQESTSWVGNWYRIKDVATNQYITAFNHDAHTSGTNGGVGTTSLSSTNEDQIFTFEQSSSNYKLKTKSGYYIYAQEWNVDALSSQSSEFKFTENGTSGYYMQVYNTNKGNAWYYVKNEAVGGTNYLFGDAAVGAAATWVLEKVTISSADITKTATLEEATIVVTTDAPATIKVGNTTYTTTAENLTATITLNATSAESVTIESIGATITEIECVDNATPTQLPTSVTELALRNVDAGEVEIDAPALEKITVVSEAPAHEATGEEYDYKVATVVPTSDLSQGVQVVVEKEINTPQPLQDKGTPSYFNFLSMPFAFNTADIKYWDGDSWEPATAETHVRIMTYNSEIRAQGRYGETWEKVASGESIDIAANQGFVIVGNNNYGSGYKMQLQFTSAESAYIQDGRVKSVETVENTNGGTSHIFDENWNHIGAPYLTKVTAPEGKTIYTHTGYNYEQYVPADDTKTINPYQGFMLQSVGSISLEAETAVAALSLTKASESVYAKAYISVDDCAPAKIILSDESSENFVLNEDAWYMAPTANVISSNYFIVDGMEASVTVQPEASDLPMTVYAGAGTSHTISLTRIEGERNVYLKDALTDEIICLNEEDYTFTSSAKTTIANRFTISMTEPTGIIESAISEGTIKVVVSGDNIKMYGTVEGTDITLYNANGMVITNAVAEEGVTTVSTSATGVIVIKADNTVVKVVK